MKRIKSLDSSTKDPSKDPRLVQERLISAKDAMALLDIKSLNTLKRYEIEGLLTIYRFNARSWKCRLSEILAVPDKIKERQQAPIDNLRFLEELGITF